MKITFDTNSSPFRDGSGNEITVIPDLANNIPDGALLTLQKEGNFTCRCFLTLPDGSTVGWSAEHPQSGGDHNVGSGGK